MSEAKHTPTLPFKLGGCSGRMIEDAEGYLTCDCDLLANAEFIVQACNTQATLIEQRDALKTALENLIKQYQIYTNFVDHEKCWEIIQARAALAKCETEGAKP